MVSQELPRSSPHAAAPVTNPTDTFHNQQPHQQPQQQAVPWTDESGDAVWEHVSAQPSRYATPVDPSNPRHVPTIPHTPNGQINLGDQDENVWNEARQQPPGQADTNRLEQVPDLLKPGGNRAATNPFLKRKPLPQPAEAVPSEAFSKLDVNDTNQNTNPWQQTVDSQQNSTGQPTPQPRPVTAEGIESDPWAANDEKPTVSQPGPPPKSPALISLQSEEDDRPVWKEEAHRDSDKMIVESPSIAIADELLEQNVWDDLGAFKKGKGKVLDVSAAGQTAQLDDWSLIDVESSSNPSKQAKEDDGAEERPPLPSRSTGLQQKWVPSRPPVDAKAETYQVKNIRWHDTTSVNNPRTSPILIQNENGPCPLVALVNALTMTTPADNPDTTLVQVLRSREQISLNLLLDAVFDELMSPRRTNSEDALPDVSDLYAFLQSLHTGMNVNPRFVPTPEMVNAYKRTSLTHLHPTERGNLIPGTFENTMEMSLYAAFSIPLIHGWLPSQTDSVYGAMQRQAGSYEDVQNLLFREEELEEKLSTDAGLTEDEQQLYQDILTIKIFLDSSATQLTSWGIEVIGKAMRPGTFAILFRNDHFSTLYCHPQTLQLLSLVTDAGYRTHDEVVWESLVDVNGERTEYLSGDYRVVGLTGEAGPSNLNASTGDRGPWTTVQNKRGKGRQQEEEANPDLSQHEQEDRDLALALQLQEEEDQRHRDEQARRQRESILSEQYIEQQGHRPTPVNRDRRRTSASGNVGIAPERRGSSTYNIPVTTNTSHSRQPSVSQPQIQPQVQVQTQQQVRPLVPPRTRPGVTRRADSAGDDAPPSYEQAAQDPAYMPPPGHPSHSQSSNAASRQTSITSETPISHVASAQSQRMQMPMNQPGPRRQPVSQGSVGGGGRDRDCVVM